MKLVDALLSFGVDKNTLAKILSIIDENRLAEYVRLNLYDFIEDLYKELQQDSNDSDDMLPFN